VTRTSSVSSRRPLTALHEAYLPPSEPSTCSTRLADAARSTLSATGKATSKDGKLHRPSCSRCAMPQPANCPARLVRQSARLWIRVSRLQVRPDLHGANWRARRFRVRLRDGLECERVAFRVADVHFPCPRVCGDANCPVSAVAAQSTGAFCARRRNSVLHLPARGSSWHTSCLEQIACNIADGSLDESPYR
jgi:hypothetical protein